jgi:hypothetical protein
VTDTVIICRVGAVLVVNVKATVAVALVESVAVIEKV